MTIIQELERLKELTAMRLRDEAYEADLQELAGLRSRHCSRSRIAALIEGIKALEKASEYIANRGSLCPQFEYETVVQSALAKLNEGL